MLYKIHEYLNPKVEEMYERSMSELNTFFDKNWKQNRPRMILVPDRKTINALRGEQTSSRIVGWAEAGGICILDFQNFEKESDHEYSDERYFALIKHELAHCFSRLVSNSSQKPIWLMEGISIYLSGQNKFKEKPNKLENFIDAYDEKVQGTYTESGFAIMFLVEKYGKEKLLILLKGSKNADSKEKFADLFESIYGFDLEYSNFELQI